MDVQVQFDQSLQGTESSQGYKVSSGRQWTLISLRRCAGAVQSESLQGTVGSQGYKESSGRQWLLISLQGCAGAVG